MDYREQEIGQIVDYQKKTMDMIWESMFGGEKTEETENPWGDRDYPDMGDKVNDDLLDR